MTSPASAKPRPFRFGFQAQSVADGAAWRELARKTESLGYSTLLLPDHFGESWNPTVPLSVAASVTSTLRVGSLVYANDYRHPLVLARDIAALDVLSDGRVEFGLGAGWMTTDYEQSGIPLDRPGVRIERMAEAVEICRGLWTGEPYSFTGAHYTLRDALCRPVPATPGGPPLTIGGGGKKVLTFAAKHASVIGVNVELTDGKAGSDAAKTAVAERYLERIGWIREAAGDRFADIELQLLCFFEQVTPDRETLYANMAPMFGLTPDQAARVPLVLAGTVEQIIEDLHARREQYGFSYIVVHDVDAFAPVVAALAGT